MKLENAMLLMAETGCAKVVTHPPDFAIDRKYGTSVGACFSIYKKLTDEQKVIHLLFNALVTLEMKPELQAIDVLNALEEIEDIKQIIDKCMPGLY